MVDWSALPPQMWWRQAAVAPPRYSFSAGSRALGSLDWGDLAGTSAEAALLGQRLRFTWHGIWSRQLQVQLPDGSHVRARYRPTLQTAEDGLLFLPDGTSYRWHAPSRDAGPGHWVGPGAIASPTFANVSDRWEVRVEVARPASADRREVPVLLLLLGSYLTLADALSRHSPAVLG